MNPTLESFLQDVASHELTVNLDSGVYRDITIANPNTMAMHYNIIALSGDFLCCEIADLIFESVRLTTIFGIFAVHSN